MRSDKKKKKKKARGKHDLRYAPGVCLPACLPARAALPCPALALPCAVITVLVPATECRLCLLACLPAAMHHHYIQYVLYLPYLPFHHRHSSLPVNPAMLRENVFLLFSFSHARYLLVYVCVCVQAWTITHYCK